MRFASPLLLFLSACSSAPIGPDLRLVVVNTVDAAKTCSGTDLALSTLGDKTNIRVTVRVRKADGSTALCDATFGGSERVALAYPQSSGALIDLFAEAFDVTAHRLASGALLAVDFSKSLPDLRLFPSENFRCNANGSAARFRLTQPRAFHTATALPSGEVLILGGLIPSLEGGEGPTKSGDSLYVTDIAELYDPGTGTFTVLSGAKPLPRAFHQAALLPEDGSHKVRVLLVGGLSTSSRTEALVRDYMGQPIGFRWAPAGTNLANAAAEILTYDPVARSISRSNGPAGMHSLALQAGAPLPGGGMVVAGGGTPSSGSIGPEDHCDVTDGTKLQQGKLADTRLAAALVALDGMRALLIGGMLSSSGGAPFQQLDLQTAKGSPVEAKGLSLPPLQFATLVALDPPGTTKAKLLVAGGLEVVGQSATQPPSGSGGLYQISSESVMQPCVDNPNQMCPALPILATQPTGTLLFDEACKNPSRYRPAAWNAATRLATGDRVLITGGTARNVYTQPTCHDCSAGDDVLSCALDQAAVYRIATNELAQIAPEGAAQGLLIPRFGHTQTLLPSGNVLIVGGLTRRGTPKGTYAVAEAEVWNPARRQPVIDSATMTDLDDPVRADLLVAKLSRMPGQAATPSIACLQPK